MTGNYDFKLTPAYCLYNGVGVFEQNGAHIKILIEDFENHILRERLSRAFCNYLELVSRYDDCPEQYRDVPKIEFIKAKRSEIRKSVSALYSFETSDSEKKCSAEKIGQQDAAAVLLLDTILSEGRRLGATDVHIENCFVRFRIKGRLQKYQVLKRNVSAELIQRIKLLADMNVMEKHHCQDGHFSWDEKNPLFVRVSTVCVIGKNYISEEAVVMRLLDTERVPLLLDKLGFNEIQLEQIRLLQQMKSGLVLVCGPTGAGKSTTVASILMEMERMGAHTKKIVSLEEPPEYFLPGISQFQINQKDGLSYDEALSHVFRQDPDVIMIGEIRDEMGASAAVRASLTGHLVFATLHTGGVGEAVLRLGNLGVSKKLLASVLNGIIVQDLIFIDKESELHADVGIPLSGFDSLIDDTFGDSELDELFTHYTNYSDAFANTLARLNQNFSKEVSKTSTKIKNRKSRFLLPNNAGMQKNAAGEENVG